MQRGKSPGIDGIPIEFYILFWPKIRNLLLDSFKYSFQNNVLPFTERLSVLSLIHKGKDLDHTILNNWRPLSLLNVDYKIIAKVLATRLEKILYKIIGEQQSGFVKGRQISSVHRVIDDVMNYHRVRKREGIILAIDFKQAFDSLNIHSIFKSLEIFGFGDNFIKWVKILNKDRLSCVQNGGHMSRSFKISNGVRQGCPLSAQLFTISVELLAQKILQCNDIQGLKLGNLLNPIKISQYADDTTLFLKNVRDVQLAISIFDTFKTCSNLHLNFDKSFAISLNGLHINLQNNIKCKDCLKILGIYFSNKKAAYELQENYTKRLEKVNKMFQLWSKRDLTILGKMHIIKTFALSQFIFIMNSISIPNNILDEINTLFHRFLWKKRFDNLRATEKINRKTLTNALEDGGIKMINLISFQKSFLLSWVEKLLNPGKEPWKYTAHSCLHAVGGLTAFKSNLDPKDFNFFHHIVSPFWKTCLTVWLENAENTLNTSVSYSDPIFNNILITFQGKPIFLPSCIQTGVSCVNDFMFDNSRTLSLLEFRNKFGNFPRLILDYNILKSAFNRLLSKKTLQTGTAFYFKKETVGKIGRKAFLKHISQHTHPLCNSLWERKYGIIINKFHWRMAHSPNETRLKALNYKLLHNIYPSNILLHKMKITNTDNCPWCNNETDFIEHMFFKCLTVKPLWAEIEKVIFTKLNHSLELTEEHIILGLTHINGITKMKTEQINLIISIGRLAISKFRYGPKRALLEIFHTDMNLRNIKLI